MLFPGRIDGAANVVGLDGKLAVPAVNENQKLNGAGPAVIKDGFEGRSDGSACVEDARRSSVRVISPSSRRSLDSIKISMQIKRKGLIQIISFAIC